MNKNKANPINCISTKELQENIDICAKPLYRIINLGIEKSKFEEGIKLAYITPVYKAKNKTDNSNYGPVSGLPAGSNVFERIMQKQISEYIDDYLSQYLCGYRKGYSAQNALIVLLEQWRKMLDKKRYAGAILMDLSKSSDTLNYDLLIAKLFAYGFEKNL